MDRRTFMTGSVAAAAFFRVCPAEAQDDPLALLIKEVEADPTLIENGWQYRTREITRGVGTGNPSKRPISKRASDMIIAFEVVSQERYEQRYVRPIWPKGQSGVTIGIGYDLRFVNAAMLQRDWGDLLDAPTLALLRPVLRMGGTRARDALPRVQGVMVPWSPADRQFRAFLPYAVAQTERVFPNHAELSDDSMGALVSLVYNRGPSAKRGVDSRREMLRIQELMRDKAYAEVPAQIRAMKRLWQGKPDARGLLIRRDAEAVLFEQGLA